MRGARSALRAALALARLLAQLAALSLWACYCQALLRVESRSLRRSVRSELLSQGLPAEVASEVAEAYARDAREAFRELCSVGRWLGVAIKRAQAARIAANRR